MESLYCGGRFYFDYLQDGYLEKAAEDYRSRLLADVNLLLKGDGKLRLSAHAEYIGPFYFETDGMLDRDIVSREMKQIEACTYAFFLLNDSGCPGTISEMIYAAALGKKVCIFYIRDERETESRLHTSCWYPILQCQMINSGLTEVVSCMNYEEAVEKIMERVNKLP